MYHVYLFFVRYTRQTSDPRSKTVENPNQSEILRALRTKNKKSVINLANRNKKTTELKR